MNPNEPLQPTNDQPLPSPAAVPPPQFAQPQPPVIVPVAPQQFPVPSQPRPTQYVPTHSAPPQNTESGRGKKIVLVIIPIIVFIIIVIAVILVVSSGSKQYDSSADSTAPALDPKASGKANNTPATLTRTPLNKKISTEYGYSVTATEVVTGYTPKYPADDVDPIFIKLTVAEESKPKYTGSSPQVVDFVLVVDGQEVTKAQYYIGASTREIEQAGYPELPIQQVTAAAPNTGYVMFGVPKGKKPSAIRYKQKQAKVLGSQTILPPKDYDIAL